MRLIGRLLLKLTHQKGAKGVGNGRDSFRCAEGAKSSLVAATQVEKGKKKELQNLTGGFLGVQSIRGLLVFADDDPLHFY